MSEVVFTRKKKGGLAPRESDLHAWKHNGSPQPEPVIRSPEDPDKWLSEAEWQLLLVRLSQEEIPFTSRRSQRPLLRPKPGHYGWFRPHHPNKLSRDRYEYTLDGRWIPAPTGDTDEF